LAGQFTFRAVAAVFAFGYHRVCEVWVAFFDFVFDHGHYVPCDVVGSSAQAFSGHIDEGLGVSKHSVVDWLVAADVAGVVWGVIAVGFNEVFDADFMAGEVGAGEGRDIGHFNPEDLGSDRGVFGVVEVGEGW